MTGSLVLVPDLEPLLELLSAELGDEGASGVALMGSHARGTAHALSDIDLYALGDGPEYVTQRRESWLVTVSWRTRDAVLESFSALPGCIQAVPGWRAARILSDPRGEGARLIEAASAWSWAQIPDPDAWCAAELPGYAEEVQKLQAALSAKDDVSAAVWRNVLALRIAAIMAVRLRFLLMREEDQWPRVADTLGKSWSKAQRTALGLSDASFEETCHAAIDLYAMAVTALAPFMNVGQLAVARGGMSAS